MSVILLLSIETGFGLKQTCRPFCTGSDCITVNQERVDFKTAEEACHDRNGELLTFLSEIDETILDILSQDLYGNFWIGLHLPAGACSNLSAPLRGYEWTSGSMHPSFIPSSITWADRVKVCSPRCVTCSNGQKWTERLCSDKTDGFLCKTKHKDACQAQKLSDKNFFQSSKGCSSGPCEHLCTDVKGGYKCSCYRGYIPDSKDLSRCKVHCGGQKCHAICEGDNDTCFCPDGFLRTGKFCEDIDECIMDWCDQECKNTFGGFVCSCRKGFVLDDSKVNCIKAQDSESFVITTPIAIGFVANNTTLKVSYANTGGFLWLWIFVALTVVVSIFVIRFYVVKRQKRREQNSTAPVDNIEC